MRRDPLMDSLDRRVLELIELAGENPGCRLRLDKVNNVAEIWRNGKMLIGYGFSESNYYIQIIWDDVYCQLNWYKGEKDPQIVLPYPTVAAPDFNRFFDLCRMFELKMEEELLEINRENGNKKTGYHYDR